MRNIAEKAFQMYGTVQTSDIYPDLLFSNHVYITKSNILFPHMLLSLVFKLHQQSRQKELLMKAIYERCRE